MVVSTTAAVAALLSTGMISLAPNLILFLFPNYGVGEGEQSESVFLTLGQAVAAGGLLGDVFLHTLPHASAQEDAGLWVIVGFTIFYASDLLIRSLEFARNNNNNNNNSKSATSSSSTEEPPRINNNDSNNNEVIKNNSQNHHHKHSHPSHHHSVDHKASFVFLNLAADALHNFTDGLAIGATYAVQKDMTNPTLGSLLMSRGGLASISILFHEVPHELGDFCSLIRAGYSKKQAILAQFLTAVAAFIGTMVALCVTEGLAGHRVLFVTGGGFVYLAATTILPEVLDDNCSFPYRLAQLAAFCTGVAFLYAVSLLEEHDHGHDSGDHHHHHHHHEHEHADESIHSSEL